MRENVVKNAIINGTVKVIENGHGLICPSCKEVRVIRTRESVRRSLASTMKCNKCSKVGTHIGKKLSKSIRDNMSISQKNRYLNNDERLKTGKIVKISMHRPDVRERHINALHRSKWIKVKTDHGQIELINKWNSIGFNFEINHQIKIFNDLFYLDGYDSERNVVIEYDSKYHNKPNRKILDKQRENKIINFLNPTAFRRYNSTDKKFIDVYRKTDHNKPINKLHNTCITT